MRQPTGKPAKAEPTRRGVLGVGTAPLDQAADDACASIEATDSGFRPVTRAAALRWRGDKRDAVTDSIAEEVPAALVYNGISHAVMMTTPADLEDFAFGFSLSEGILTKTSELYGIELTAAPGGLVVDMEISAARFAALRERRRSLAGRTGCGLCGIDSLDQAIRPASPVRSDLRFRIPAIRQALARLPDFQVLNRKTGSLHAAAWAQSEGAIVTVREDVGRHNALDKLIGALARSGVDFGQGFALLSSRLSYELVQKAAAVGIPLLVAISAPTALALRMAEECGITAVGFARADALTIYTHPERLN